MRYIAPGGHKYNTMVLQYVKFQICSRKATGIVYFLFGERDRIFNVCNGFIKNKFSYYF
jgi:hypothetical protein